MTSELETQLVSVERVKEYSETDTEVTDDSNSNKNLKLLNSELKGFIAWWLKVSQEFNSKWFKTSLSCSFLCSRYTIIILSEKENTNKHG